MAPKRVLLLPVNPPKKGRKNKRGWASLAAFSSGGAIGDVRYCAQASNTKYGFPSTFVFHHLQILSGNIAL